MYTEKNYKTKKALKEAVARGDDVMIYQPGPFGHGIEFGSGQYVIEGPHYPAPHSWYASATLTNGQVTKVK